MHETPNKGCLRFDGIMTEATRRRQDASNATPVNTQAVSLSLHLGRREFRFVHVRKCATEDLLVSGALNEEESRFV